MDAQYFVYTRGHNIANDYKLLFSPSEDFCPQDVRKHFLVQARGLINLDMYGGDLDKNPRWIFSKKNGYTLWGVATMNKKLSPTHNTDYTNRPVRGFFGMVVKDNSISSLPFDLTFFEHFYSKHIVELWDALQEDFKKTGVCVDADFDKYVTITPNNSNLPLNTNEKKTVIWEDTLSPEEFFSNALAIDGDFSCVYGLEEKSHAFNHDYRFYNVVVKGAKSKEEKIYQEKKPVRRDEEDPCMPKKGYSPKLRIWGIIAVLIALALIIGRCSKSQQAPSQNSVSGDSTETIKTMHK